MASVDPSTGVASVSLGLGNLTTNLNWNPSRETNVNRSGGGYRLYYQVNQGVNITKAPYVLVGFNSGSQSPTALTLAGLAAGTYYFKIVAFGSTKVTNSSSVESAELSVSLP